MISKAQAISILFIIVATANIFARQTQQQLYASPVDELCLGCMCEAISKCNTTLQCYSDVCGLFKITWAYWADANKPILKFDNPNNPQAFARCVTDPECAARTVRGYMSKFAKDCNGDGKIDCWDYLAIHMLGGGDDCKARVESIVINRFADCQRQVSMELLTRTAV